MKANKIGSMRIIHFLLILIYISNGNAAYAQATPKEKLGSIVQLTVYNNADNSRTALVNIIAFDKVLKKRHQAKVANINIYTVFEGAQKLILSTHTGMNGKAEIVLPSNLPIDTGNNYDVIAKIENDPVYDNGESEARFKNAKLTLTLKQEDTIKTATATLTEKDKNGKDVPVNNVEIGFFAKRLFGAMPVAEDNKVTTDANGQAVFNFPKINTIPGDEKGNMDIVARVSDNEKYGNIESVSASNWGVPVQIEKNPFPRVLWGASAPPALVVTICTLFGGIWSIFIFMLLQLRKISREKYIS